MSFSPFNPIVKLCLQGMQLEEQGKNEEALQVFMQAWETADSKFEKFIAAHYVARRQKNTTQKLQWLQTQLALALEINDTTVHSAIANIYKGISLCYKELSDEKKALEAEAQSLKYNNNSMDKGPFYHGTKAHLAIGDLLVPGGNSNYKEALKMNHIYFTGLVNGAGLAAALAKGDGAEHVYVVEPTGSFENDPNLTDKKFPGNPTRSYRSVHPLRIITEVKEWERPAEEDLQRFRAKLEENKGDIIN